MKKYTDIRWQQNKLFISRDEETLILESWPMLRSWRKLNTCGKSIPIQPFLLMKHGGFKAILSNREPEPVIVQRFINHFRLDNSAQLHIPLPGSREEFENFQKKSCYRFICTIPKKLRKLIEQFNQGQWQLLQMLARNGDEARKLLVNHPMLGFCLAHGSKFNRNSQVNLFTTQRKLLSKSEQQILLWLGFPDSKTVLEQTRKIKPESLSIAACCNLMKSIHDDKNRVLDLLTRPAMINAGALELITNPRISRYVTLELVEDVARNSSEDFVPLTADSLEDLVRISEEYFCYSRLKEFHSAEEIRHELESIYFNEFSHLLEHVFPAPPFPGDSRIIPIKTNTELIKEFIQQHNYFNYDSFFISEMDDYYYRVMYPERAMTCPPKTGPLFKLVNV
jgi:hypothetical protein